MTIGEEILLWFISCRRNYRMTVYSGHGETVGNACLTPEDRIELVHSIDLPFAASPDKKEWSVEGIKIRPGWWNSTSVEFYVHGRMSETVKRYYFTDRNKLAHQSPHKIQPRSNP